ncbi:helix-turn-helix transcriptional regulator [Rhizobium leguminosarum]|uniref:helix-turn-helix transcriptional regulator n=1 Tax=Rhizobium leguminosarum TaxID=384 RepID=UPI0010306A08|nr:AlpA family phage regulatory protein [Rhizobium leguminosarum]
MNDDDFRLFRICEVCRILTLSRTSLWRLRRSDSTFPATLGLTSGRVGIRRSELAAWLRARK